MDSQPERQRFCFGRAAFIGANQTGLVSCLVHFRNKPTSLFAHAVRQRSQILFERARRTVGLADAPFKRRELLPPTCLNADSEREVIYGQGIGSADENAPEP